jgi:DNA-binding MarR family transcriptional regulator
VPRKLDAETSPAGVISVPASASTAASAARLRAATARLTRRLRQSATGELTLTQLSALGTLQASGPIRLNELASREGISASTISKLIDVLERDAFVERSPDAGDGRASRVAITAAGIAVLEDLRRNGARLIDRALGALDASDRMALTAALPALERLVGWVEADDPPQ